MTFIENIRSRLVYCQPQSQNPNRRFRRRQMRRFFDSLLKYQFSNYALRIVIVSQHGYMRLFNINLQYSVIFNRFDVGTRKRIVQRICYCLVRTTYYKKLISFLISFANIGIGRLQTSEPQYKLITFTGSLSTPVRSC